MIHGKYTTIVRQDNLLFVDYGERHTVCQEDFGGWLKGLNVVTDSGVNGYKIKIYADENLVFDESFGNLVNYYESRNEDIQALTVDNNYQLYIRDIYFEKRFKIDIEVTDTSGITFSRIIAKIFKRVTD